MPSDYDFHDFLVMDRSMTKSIHKVFMDPRLHKFCSEHDMEQDRRHKGEKASGRWRARKTVCYHCGKKRAEHGPGEGKEAFQSTVNAIAYALRDRVGIGLLPHYRNGLDPNYDGPPYKRETIEDAQFWAGRKNRRVRPCRT